MPFRRTSAFVGAPFTAQWLRVSQPTCSLRLSTRCVAAHSSPSETAFVSSFMGLKFCTRRRATRTEQRQSLKMLVDPWSVSPDAFDALAAQFFAVSLFPYLGFLYFLNKEEVACPSLANFGFRFLLVFVFATIPAGIYAKLHYHDILANVDWLHGGAESLLTITNLLIVLGFRNVIPQSTTEKQLDQQPSVKLNATLLSAVPVVLLALSGLSIHLEPSNALSFPTWIIHLSSLVEWLVAMGLIWKYADTSGNQRWKGLTWGMLPLHTSGICACTYHLFYNAPSLNGLVALQAFLTCIGNGTMAVATYRIFRGGQSTKRQSMATSVPLVGFEDLADGLQGDTNLTFFGKVFLLSAVGSGLVKWGSLLFDQPFQHSLPLALSFIIVPTALNMLKWGVRSRSGSSDFGGYL